MTRITLHDVLEINQRIESKIDEMGKRVSTLELWRAEIMGKLTIAVAFVTLALNASWEYLRTKFIK